MKTFLAICVTALALSAAENQPAKDKPEPAPKSAEVTVDRIPEGAVETESGYFHYTDSQSKKWVYRKTPWGIKRWEEIQAPPNIDAKAARIATDPYFANVKAVEDGDVIKFERPGPFGMVRWERNKSELTDKEKAIWERERAKAAQKHN